MEDGARMGRPRRDYTGARFGAWLVLGESERRPRSDGRFHVYLRCRCDCGAESVIAHANLKHSAVCTGHPQESLDARRAEREQRLQAQADARERQAADRESRQHAAKERVEDRARERAVSRTLRKMRAFGSWREMLQRCTQPTHQDYPNYGGRGIKVCDRWRDSFASFLADMGERPEGKTLDRRDNDLGYSPENCQWATPTEQNRNSRHCKLTVADVLAIRDQVARGVRAHVLADRYGVTPANIHAVHRRDSWRDVA